MKQMTSTGNNLALASSPYLLQHAHNPVDWYEWGEEALVRSKKENKALLISIGYAACHWCHVMAHESFEDPAIAAYMNAHFINIKIDREERPDIDQIYMDAVQLITGQGGWPLNAFALPDGRPFYAGTYFPKDNWMKLLEQLVHLYEDDFAKLEEQANAVTEGINNTNFVGLATAELPEFKKSKYSTFFSSYERIIDYESGGYNRAPKFPLPVSWEFLLQYHYLNKNPQVLKAVNITLTEISKGGIYDQIGGGFARYSVDKIWKAPHFEKMLYDNGQLISLYAHAFQITHNQDYERIIRQTLTFIERELMSKEGGFYSSLDADSEGVEGKFYVWTEKEMDEVLDRSVLELMKEYYQIRSQGNWEHGNNILFSKYIPLEFEKKMKLQTGEFLPILNQANALLLAHRNKRVRPGLDDKILTSWNALMLKGYVDAYRSLGDDSFLRTALQNANFLVGNMITKDGGLWRNYKNGKASISAFLDDYALLADAFLELYQVSFDKKWLDQSKAIADYVLNHFSDNATGLFFYTSDQSESLAARKHEVADNVIPASNSVFALVLYKLGKLFDEENYTQRSLRMLQQVENEILAGGPYYAKWEMLYGLVSHNVSEVAILGEEAIQKSLFLQKDYLPTSLFLGGQVENLELLKGKLLPDQTLIYVCQNKVCKIPTSDPKAALEQIKSLPEDMHM